MTRPIRDRHLEETDVQTPAPRRFQVTDCLKFYETHPCETTDRVATWYGRGQNFIVAYSVAKDGALLERSAEQDESMLLLPDPASAATVTGGGETVAVKGHSLTILPPGDSSVRLDRGGVAVRLFTARAADLAARCLNRDSYVEGDPNVPPFQPLAEPPGGFRIRSYSLDVPEEPGRFGRIWQSSALMVNVFHPQGPRDVTKMTPHHHDDFQQGLLVLEGECIHHLRWPWGPDLRTWREDEHPRCGAPSLTIIPPPALHTSQMIGADNLLVDIFSPPRADFAAREGWVLNLHDYPRQGEGAKG